MSRFEDFFRSMAQKLDSYPEGVTTRDVQQAAYKNPYSRYINPRSYDPELRQYYCVDGTAGFIFELGTMCFAGEEIYKALEALIKNDYPDNTTMSFMLFSDKDIKPILRNYKHQKRNSDNNEILNKSVDRAAKFFEHCTEGIPGAYLQFAKNFRLIFSIRWSQLNEDKDQTKRRYGTIKEALIAAQLHPRDVPPGDYLALMRKILNGESKFVDPFVYDDKRVLAKQIISGETVITERVNSMRIDKKFAIAITPKAFPPQISPLIVKQMITGYKGREDDDKQIPTEFLYCVNIFIDKRVPKKIKDGAWLSDKQQVKTSKEKEQSSEFQIARDMLQSGEVFVSVMPILFLFGEDKDHLEKHAEKVKNNWKALGITPQKEIFTLKLLLLYTLPLNAFSDPMTLDTLVRTFNVTAGTAAFFVPIQTDMVGMLSEPTMLMLGRSGQVIGFNPFARGKTNYNGIIFGGSGQGKSVMLSTLIKNCIAEGTQVYIFDLGRSFRSVAELYGGRYIDLDADTKISLNPFANLDEDDIDAELSSVASIILMMDDPEGKSTGDKKTIIENVITEAYGEKGGETTIGDVYRILLDKDKMRGIFHKYFSDEESLIAKNLINTAMQIAFNIEKFTEGHSYGKYLTGEGEIDFTKDQAIIIEMQSLTNNKTLFPVLVTLLTQKITSAFYSDKTRGKKKLLVVEEAHQFYRSSSQEMEHVIEQAYRRARKHFGGIWMVTQGVDDLENFGVVKEVVGANSETKIYFKQSNVQDIVAKGLLPYKGFLLDYFRTVETKTGLYSECFVHGAEGVGIMRLFLDKRTLLEASSTGDDYQLKEKWYQELGDYEQAIKAALREKYGESYVDYI